MSILVFESFPFFFIIVFCYYGNQDDGWDEDDDEDDDDELTITEQGLLGQLSDFTSGAGLAGKIDRLREI